MLHDVVSAIYEGDYKIELTFDDGKKGVIDFSSYLTKGGVFKNFENLAFFKQFSVNSESGTLTWPNEIDISPEKLYTTATGSPLPTWMET